MREIRRWIAAQGPFPARGRGQPARPTVQDQRDGFFLHTRWHQRPAALDAGTAVTTTDMVTPAIGAPADAPQRQRLDVERADCRKGRLALRSLAFLGRGVGEAALVFPASAVGHDLSAPCFWSLREARRRSNPGSLAVIASRARLLRGPVIGPRDVARARWLAMTRSRDAAASESCQRFARTGPRKRGRRSAERRVSNQPRHTFRCCHLNVVRARRAPRMIRLHEPFASGALAFRRSTAAFVAGQTLASRSRPRFTRSGGRRRYPRH